MIRVFLVDDHTVLRTGIRNALATRDNLVVVEEAGSGPELLEKLANTPADVVLLDINMPGMDGLETLSQLRKDFPGVRVLMLSMLENEQYMQRALDGGAHGYILKSVGVDELVQGIEAVAAGRFFLCAEAGMEALRKLKTSASAPGASAPGASAPDASAPGADAPQLSQREREVLQLIAEGFTNQEIADKLFTSKRTIETHRQNILDKTNMRNTAALIRYAVQEGIVS
ncbi:response regulator transcription factor [Hymenobacter saemangeumensis]|uniref:Response regulator transcription factor n=1 Tax=Hymenobacter saemangeumensis TaxID=1084522 RepID=A0ABP8IRE2_9BACT